MLCTIAETVGLSPAATPGAPSIPMGKDAMTPWIFFSSRPPFYHKSHYVTRFLRQVSSSDASKKGSTKLGFFLHCIQDSPTSSFHLQNISLFPPCCKGRLSIFDLCWGDFTTSPFYCIGHLFQIFNHPRGSVERKTPFLHPV